MFKHKGKARNFKHNLAIASTLSFVAGIVNAVGFLAVARLTTNVTGHFAFMVEEAVRFRFNQAVFFLIYILMFLFGAFFSNISIEITNRINYKYKFIFPIIVEILILTLLAFISREIVENYPNIIACSLLFAMGLQNSLVTTISNSVVRTTHLTGLFTDLGIELAQLFFYKLGEERTKLVQSIRLRLAIIGSFFIGGAVAGTLYSIYGMKTILIGSATLFIGLVIDTLIVKIKQKLILDRIRNNNGLIK